MKYVDEYRDGRLAKRVYEPRQPFIVGGNGVCGQQGKKPAPRRTDPNVQRVAKGEVFQAERDEARAITGGNCSRAIDRPRIDQHHLKILVTLAGYCLKNVRKPPLLIEGANDNAGFWRALKDRSRHVAPMGEGGRTGGVAPSSDAAKLHRHASRKSRFRGKAS